MDSTSQSSLSSSKPGEINNTQITNFPQLGKGLTATTSLSSGSLVFSTSDPYHILVENSALSKVCSWCLLVPPLQVILKRCSACKIPWYCSPLCQKTSWSRGEHKYECPSLAKLGEGRQLPTPIRAVMQLLLRESHKPGNKAIWQGLESHEVDFKKDTERWDDIVLQAQGAMMFSGLTPSSQLLEDAIGLLCRMKTNAFHATTPDGLAMGLLLHPLVAMANHSCDPNAELRCEGREISLVALADIEEGEQIVISYVDENLRLEERSRMLEEGYFFRCVCKWCVLQGRTRDRDPP